MWEAVDAAGTADVAEDVSDWIATPATLNDKSQERRQFSSNNSIVQRRQPENERDGCVCYTVHSLPPGQVWQNTILETSTTRKWSEGLVSGSCRYNYTFCTFARVHTRATVFTRAYAHQKHTLLKRLYDGPCSVSYNALLVVSLWNSL